MNKLKDTSHSFLSQALENAVAQQHFEGLHPSDALLRDLEQVAAGQMTIQAVIANIGNRYGNVQVFGQ